MFARFSQYCEYEYQICCDSYDTAEYHILDTPPGEESTDRRSDEEREAKCCSDHSHILGLGSLGRYVWYICLSDSEPCSTESWDESGDEEYDKKKADISWDNPRREREPEDDISEQVERCGDR